MRIIIVGDGKVGVALTKKLSEEGHDIVIIDSNQKVLTNSLETYDVMVIHGNGASMEVLKEADVKSADLLIAATSSDEINLLTCILAKKMGDVHTISRVRNPEYVEQMVFMKDELGLSMTINPELSAATEAYNVLQFPSFIQRDTFAKGRVEIVKIKITGDSKLCGVKLSKLGAIVKLNVLVCAVERGDDIIIPRGDFALREDDNIYVTADTTCLAGLIKQLGVSKQKVRNVLIIGGSRIAYYLAKLLVKSGVGVKIIEQRHQRCVELSEDLPEVSVVEGDGSDKSILDSEGILECDALVTLTNLDEENLIVSMYGNHVGVGKVITKINRTEYLDVFRNMGIDSVISPKRLCTADIVRYVRARENTTGGSVIALHQIAEGRAEALEFSVSHDTRYRGTPLSKIKIKQNVLIACITRSGVTVIPKGDDSFDVGDTVIVVTVRHNIYDLNDIFE